MPISASDVFPLSQARANLSELADQVKAGDSVKAMAKVKEKNRHLSRDRDGPEHGMSM